MSGGGQKESILELLGVTAIQVTEDLWAALLRGAPKMHSLAVTKGLKRLFNKSTRIS